MITHQSPNKNWRVMQATGLHDILDHITTAPALWGRTSDSYGDVSFYGTKTKAEALTLARFGWPEGRSKMTEAVKAANVLQPSAPVLEVAYGMAGAYPDVGLFCSGDPACMVSVDPDENATKPVYSFIVNVAALAYISNDAIMNRGAAILSYADKLEREGAQVEIMVMDGSQRGDKIYTWICPLKSVNEALDVDKAAFVMGHPAMLRRIGFAIQERDAICGDWLGGSYGRCNNDVPPAIEGPRSVHFPDMSDSNDNVTYATLESALAAVEETIRAALG